MIKKRTSDDFDSQRLNLIPSKDNKNFLIKIHEVGEEKSH